jgi:hypothetical protein
MAQIVIKVSLSIADALKKERNISGIAVSPMHPGTNDEELETLFVAEVQQPLIGLTLAALNDSGMIQSAHVK